VNIGKKRWRWVYLCSLE